MACEFPIVVKAKLMLTAIHFRTLLLVLTFYCRLLRILHN